MRLHALFWVCCIGESGVNPQDQTKQKLHAIAEHNNTLARCQEECLHSHIFCICGYLVYFMPRFWLAYYRLYLTTPLMPGIKRFLHSFLHRSLVNIRTKAIKERMITICFSNWCHLCLFIRSIFNYNTPKQSYSARELLVFDIGEQNIFGSKMNQHVSQL